jgi:hypothetical protein
VAGQLEEVRRGSLMLLLKAVHTFGSLRIHDAVARHCRWLAELYKSARRQPDVCSTCGVY